MFAEWPAYLWITGAVTIALVIVEIIVHAKSFWGMFSHASFWRYLFVSLFLNELAVLVFKIIVFKGANPSEAIFIGVLTSEALLQEMKLKLGTLSLDIPKIQTESMSDAVEDISKSKAFREDRRTGRLAKKLTDLCKGKESWLEEQYVCFNPEQSPEVAQAKTVELHKKYESDQDTYRLILANIIVNQDYRIARSIYWARIKANCLRKFSLRKKQ